MGSSIHVRNPSLQQFRTESHNTLPDNEPQVDVIIIDGSALVNSLPPGSSKTFEEYATLDVIPTIRAYSIKYERTDIVFDVYRPSSLKAEARSKRGHGARRRVSSRCKVPSNWHNFLRDNDNKTDLFNFLADKIEQMPSPNTGMVIVTKEENVLSNHTISLEGVSPCSHEESDTCIFVHARHATQEGRFLDMSRIALLDLRKADELHSFMPSLVVMWSQPSVVKETICMADLGHVC